MKKGWVKKRNPRKGRSGEGGVGLFFFRAGSGVEKEKRSARNSG
jgi:hypothetical protein